jgi:5-hydroxyisourate hydrolase
VSGITTHVLDVTRGKPAAGVRIDLEAHSAERGWVKLAERTTDNDGRVRDFMAEGSRLDAGRYRLTFHTGAYFGQRETATFYPQVPVEFEITDANQHYHVPLLVSAFGYSTYRGS